MKVLLLIMLMVVVVPSQQYSDYWEYPVTPYEYAWGVDDHRSGNDYGHEEQSDGRVVSGSYCVLLPDGRRQTVSYRVEGDSGYVANVRYD